VARADQECDVTFIRRWYRYWTRMAVTGLVAGILIGSIADEANSSHFDYVNPPTGHTATGRR
jgi:hypothetical protein